MSRALAGMTRAILRVEEPESEPVEIELPACVVRAMADQGGRWIQITSFDEVTYRRGDETLLIERGPE